MKVKLINVRFIISLSPDSSQAVITAAPLRTSYLILQPYVDGDIFFDVCVCVSGEDPEDGEHGQDAVEDDSTITHLTSMARFISMRKHREARQFLT